MRLGEWNWYSMGHEQDFSHWVQAAFRTMVTKFLLAALTMDPKGMSSAMTDPFPEHNGLKLDAHQKYPTGAAGWLSR